MKQRPQPAPCIEYELLLRLEKRAGDFESVFNDSIVDIDQALKDLAAASMNADLDVRLHAQRIKQAAMGEKDEALITDAENQVATLPWR